MELNTGLAGLDIGRVIPNVDCLGQDVLVEIMASLGALEVGSAARVSQRWRQAATAHLQALCDDDALGCALAYADKPALRHHVLIKHLRSITVGHPTMTMAFVQDGRMQVPCDVTDDTVRLRAAPFELWFRFATEGTCVAVCASTARSTWDPARAGVPLTLLAALELSRRFDVEADATPQPPVRACYLSRSPMRVVALVADVGDSVCHPLLGRAWTRLRRAWSWRPACTSAGCSSHRR